jgi:hypothetical protein
MYLEHELFKPPDNPKIPLWRYMDLPKFLTLLEDEALYFARSDTMVDKFEGAISPINLAMRRQRGEEEDAFREAFRRFTYLSCWHASEHESAAMWGLYQRDGRGIAIRSTFRRLTKSLQGDHLIMVGTVNYVDYDNQYIHEGNALAPYIYKRISFEHEREVRAVIQDLAWVAELSGSEDVVSLSTPTPIGLSIPVDLARLIETVYIAPEAPGWFAELVEKVIRRYGHQWPIRHSDLSRDPVY